MVTSTVRSLGAALAVAVLALAVAAPGCNRHAVRDKGVEDKEAAWARKLRPPADEKQLSGLDDRAKEIERNLGVR